MLACTPGAVRSTTPSTIRPFFQVRLTLSEPTRFAQVKQQMPRIIDRKAGPHLLRPPDRVPTMRLVSEARHEREHAPLLILGQKPSWHVDRL